MTDGGDQFDPENADVLMGYVLNHYIKHYDVVFKKLGHAKSATHQSIKEISKTAKHSESKVAQELAEMQAYDAMWEKIIEMFQEAGVGEEELAKIELVLNKIPRLIKKYYDLLVEQDTVLQELMVELESEEYKKALAITRKIQAKPDMLSGLDPSEFDLEINKNAFIFKIPSIRDSIH